MKNTNLNRPRFLAQPPAALRRWAYAGAVGCSLLGLASLQAATVETLSGGPLTANGSAFGYADGSSLNEAQYHTPLGLALNPTEELLYVADRDNNAIRVLNLGLGQTLTFTTNLIRQPVGVAVDKSDNVYVLNRGTGANGSLVKFDLFGDLIETYPGLGPLVNATGISLDSAGNIFLAVNGNTLAQVVGTNTFSLVTKVVVTNAGTSLQGIVAMRSGWVAACDTGRNGILMMNPVTGAISNIAGFNGVGDHSGSKAFVQLNQPFQVSEAGSGVLVFSDRGNHRVKVATLTGTVTNLYGVSSNYWFQGSAKNGIYPGWWDGEVSPFDTVGTVEARQPAAVLVAADGTVYTTEDYYHLIRFVSETALPVAPPPPPPVPAAPTIFGASTNYNQVILTWSTVATVTNYTVKRSPSSGGPYTTVANTTAATFTDNGVINGTTYYYVVSASNAGGESPNSAEVSATPPLPPVGDPKIGYVTFPFPFFLSSLHVDSSFVFNNDVLIAIQGAPGSQVFYTYGPTPLPGADNIPDPSPTNGATPPAYEDSLSQNQVFDLGIDRSPDMTLKAIGTKSDGSPNSAIVKARFQFVTANPIIIGNNAANFMVTNVTENAQMFYTLDGSEPTNAATSFGPISPGASLSLSGTSNITFKIRAFREHYAPSSVVKVEFSVTNYLANTISFGFESGEASSDFVGSPGQFFYAPVTLSVLEGAKMYSFQFHVTATNLVGPPVIPQFDFESMLVKPDIGNPGFFVRIPNSMFIFYTVELRFDPTTQRTVEVLIPHFIDELPNPLQNSTNDLEFTSANLLGVGWLERYGKTNLYDTIAQDLITYSQPHDTLFESKNGKVVLGGYAFRIPPSSSAGDKYKIQIGLPSATSDGVGAPGSSVFIDTPTNGSVDVGAINSIKHVTVGQRKYLVGDAAPFRWFNAGDFGNTNLLNDDVMQVFQSATYFLNMPPYDKRSWNGTGYTNVSDFFDVMDSCGGLYSLDPGGYFVPASMPAGFTYGLFTNNDTTINSIAFGDGKLDVTDVYVTFRRSLDPSLTQFRRFWTNGVRAADVAPQGGALRPALIPQATTLANPPAVTFKAGDFVGSAGQTVQIPITASIAGDFPLRVLMLNLTVEPVDGSPAVTVPVQFTPNPALGLPSQTLSSGSGNYAAVWLNSSAAGLTGNATVGTLSVTLPANAASTAAYVINFDHASASPNGLASFPERTINGVLSLANRSASSFSDGIPDTWRLRYFGTVYNQLSQASADADGDDADNAQEYGAGTDPLDAKSCLKLTMGSSGSNGLIRWLSVSGKQYRIESSPTLFGTNWAPMGTLTGTGAQVQFQDNSPDGSRFYRVQVLP